MITFQTNTRRKLVKVIIMAGQSNEDGGNAEGSIVSGSDENNRSFIYTKPINDSSSTNNGNFKTLIWGVNQSWRSTSLTFAGPELNFAHNWGINHNEPVFILKYAYGGSSLVDNGASYPNGNWQIDADPLNGITHYPILINNFVIPALVKIQNKGFVPDIVAFHWCQGETDSGDSYRSSNYEIELKRLVDQLRIDLSPYNSRGNNIAPIITRIHNHFVPPRPFASVVRTALVNVANYYNTAWIDGDAYDLGADFIHWTLTGQGTHGADVYNVYNTLL